MSVPGREAAALEREVTRLPSPRSKRNDGSILTRMDRVRAADWLLVLEKSERALSGMLDGLYGRPKTGLTDRWRRQQFSWDHERD